MINGPIMPGGFLFKGQIRNSAETPMDQAREEGQLEGRGFFLPNAIFFDTILMASNNSAVFFSAEYCGWFCWIECAYMCGILAFIIAREVYDVCMIFLFCIWNPDR